MQLSISKLRGSYNSYLLFISLSGLILAAAGVWRLFWHSDPYTFLLLSALAATAQITTTILTEGGGGISVSVSSTVSLAILPFYGPLPAALSAALAEAVLWLINIPTNRSNWRGSVPQLTFNMGMSAISLFVAGLVFYLIRDWFGADTLMGAVLPWVLGALLADQVNIWLLIVVLYLQRGIEPASIWKEHRWAMSINVLVMSVGGALLAVAVEEFGRLGITIFFLPILLSAYAFRLYAQRTRAQMDNLEEIVLARTQALADANKALAELNEQKDAFLAVLTHDMRSPLTNIHGYASLLRDHPDFPIEQRIHMTEVILRNERNLLEIVNNILDIEHLESGAPVLLDRENFNLAMLISEVIVLNAPQAQEKEIELSCVSKPESLFINADRQKIGRILQNLVSNAVKYSPEQGLVSVQAKMNGRFVAIDVCDSGYGIPLEDLPSIFDRYSRVAKHKNKAVGTGLGLAIVKSLVEAHDGDIVVTSEEGVGSTFTVRLPA